MPSHKKSFTREFASEFRKVHQANAEFANLIRELEYPAIRERIRSPPVPLQVVLVGLLNALLILAVRLPLRALARVAALLPDPPVRHDPADFDGDVRMLLMATVDTGLYAWHWLGIAGSCLWIELKILGHHALMGALLGVLYVALVMGFFWLLFAILGG